MGVKTVGVKLSKVKNVGVQIVGVKSVGIKTVRVNGVGDWQAPVYFKIKIFLSYDQE